MTGKTFGSQHVPSNAIYLFLSVSLLLGLLLAACQLPQNENISLTIFAASSLNDAMDSLAAEFQLLHPEASVQLNFASSAQLAIQLDQGAEADLFASADEEQMSYVMESDRIIQAPVNFATNSIVILVPAENPQGIAELRDLAKDGVRLLLAVPGTPLRGYSDQVLSKLSRDYAKGEELKQRIYSNVVSEEENARQVVAKIALGEADAAFAYQSDAESELAEDSLMIKLPAPLQVVATYPIAQVSGTDQPQLSAQFIEFVLSPEGQSILVGWGFGPRMTP